MSDQDWDQFAANMQQFGQNMQQLGQRMTINARHLQVGSNNFQMFGAGNINFGYGYTPGNLPSTSSTFSGNVRFVSTGTGQVFINGQRVHPTTNSTTPGTSSSSSTFNTSAGKTEVFIKTPSSSTSKPDKSGSTTEKKRPECKNAKKSSKKSRTGRKGNTAKPSATPPQESSDDEFYDAMEELTQN